MTITAEQLQQVAERLGPVAAQFFYRGDDGSYIRYPATVAGDGALIIAMLDRASDQGFIWQVRRSWVTLGLSECSFRRQRGQYGAEARLPIQAVAAAFIQLPVTP